LKGISYGDFKIHSRSYSGPQEIEEPDKNLAVDADYKMLDWTAKDSVLHLVGTSHFSTF